MGEIDDGPGHARRATEDGEDDEPGEEEDEDVGGPHAWVHEPLGVPVQIGRRDRLHVQIRHFRTPKSSREGWDRGGFSDSLLGVIWVWGFVDVLV